MIHYAWIIAFTGTLVVLGAHGFGRMSYSLILPAMRDGLALNYTQVGLIGTGNFIGYLFLALAGGFLASRFGVRRLVFFSLIVMGISLFATGLSNSFISAFFMRMVTGMGNGGAYVPIMALPAAWFAARKRGLATGIMPMGSGLGLTITGLMLPPLMSGYGREGWKCAWFVLGCAVFLFAFVSYALLRDNPAEKGLTMYGGQEPERSGSSVTMLSAWKDVWKEPEIWKLGGVYFMYGFSYIIYLTFFVVYLTKEIGISPRTAGTIFAVLGFIGIFCGILWGAISDAVGRRYGSMLAYLILALAYLLPAFCQTMAGLYTSAILFGLAMSSLPVIMAAAVGDAVGGRLAPAGLGFITVFFGVGQALGPALAGLIKDTTGSFAYAFILAAIISLAGAAGSLLMKRKP
jgi:sugar phosphate permease